MATVSFKVYGHHLKNDKSINVKLVIWHNGYSYPATDHYVTKSQIGKKGKGYKITDQDLNATLTVELGKYRKVISELGRDKLNSITAEELGEMLLPKKSGQNDAEKIDFISFSRSRVKYLREKKKTSSAGTLQAVVNNFVDFMKTDIVYTRDINSDLLRKYEAYLRKPYTQIRKDQFGIDRTIERPGMEDAGIFAHMKDFRILYKAAMEKYNNLETGDILIRNYPFAKYKLVTPPEPEKRSIPIEYVKLIRDCSGLTHGGTAEMAQAVFMMSFYLCGMNAVDIYKVDEVKDGRVSYQRSKSEGKRSDKAFISVKVVPEVRPLLNKWLGTFSKRYSTVVVFRKGISTGLKQIAVIIQTEQNAALIAQGLPADAPLVDVDFYSARHTVGNEAHNTLGFSLAEVAEVLNHSKPTVTAAYIRKMWTLVDRIQDGVIGLLRAT